MLLPFYNVRVPIVGAVSIGVKPVRVIFGGVGTPPELHMGVEPTFYLYYGLFSNTHAYGRGLPVSIIGASQVGER